MYEDFTEALLNWFSTNSRDLPWRNIRDPYFVWVSEIMLQQTRVESVIPFFERWMREFPTIMALADAQIDEVLRLWEGLGYYRRAHNLHLAARVLVDEYGGTIPSEISELRRLPGVGAYTAAAIAAIAFEVDVLAVDGNLRRVLSRLFDFSEDPRTTSGERHLRELAAPLLPRGSASLFNQALMDLGAMICKPQNPECEGCPVNVFCLSYERGTQGDRPITKKRSAIPHYNVAAGILEIDEKVLIARRPAGQLLGGLWEFPGGKCDQGEDITQCLQREWKEELGADIQASRKLGEFRHAYTHFKVTVHAYSCRLKSGKPRAIEHSEIRWVGAQDLGAYPMGKIDRAIANELANKLS